jgi:ABC-type multidrug transport system fused ATPase/permease subunit
MNNKTMNASFLGILKDVVWGFKKLFLILLALLCIDGVIAAVSVVSLAPLADFILDPELKNPSKFTQYLLSWGISPSLGLFALIFVGFNVLKSLFTVLINYGVVSIKYKVFRGLLANVMHEVLRAGWMFFVNMKHGNLLNTFLRELWQVGSNMGNAATMVANMVQLVIYLAIPFFINAKMTLVAFVVALVFSIPFFFINRFSYRLGKRSTETSNVLSGILQEILTGAKIILSYALQRSSAKEFLHSFDKNAHAVRHSQVVTEAVASLYQPLGLIAAVSALFFAMGQNIPLAEMAVVMWALIKALPFIGMILKHKTMITNVLPSYEQVQEIREQASHYQEKTGTETFNKLSQAIDLENVNYAYPGRDTTLSNVNISIPRGKMVALVGESGSGKSTVADMVMGLLTPDSGRLMIDGKTFEHWDMSSYRHHLGYVPQDSFIFNMTIRENLGWVTDREVTEEELWQACEMANAAAFIQELPEGLDTEIGDRGVRLSGGQRQRLSLARALVNQPDILVLDEATSALDSQSEKLIQQSIENIAGSTTIVAIAHRLSTIRHADHIYVMRAGTVIEEGSYAALIAKSDSTFARMVADQRLHHQDL